VRKLSGKKLAKGIREKVRGPWGWNLTAVVPNNSGSKPELLIAK